MRYRQAIGMVALGALLAVTGCTGGGSQDGGDTEAKPPPGGWPQPENGKLTPEMCGLLTDADYRKYGHNRLSSEPGRRSTNSANGIECTWTGGDYLTLDLQATAEDAKLFFRRYLDEHRERLRSDGRPTIIAQNVVPGADESWFDYWTIGSDPGERFVEHELAARRGALTVRLVLSGIKGDKEKDPRTVLSGLAALVLQRLPDVGTKDTGTRHQVRYEITGRPGTAKMITYLDPVDTKSVTLRNVKLPWKKEFPVPAPQGGAPTPLSLTATGDTSTITTVLSCRIVVDGQESASNTSPFSALCQANYGG
ncbi:MmpS family transport accessory protein [Spirillospora albida]|uniref:MmpS family transport accessory protein n=1 Tax=Spirillospora albida TaxID=58123 RepID=UPI0012F9C511|nr:MmpS family transport accessory protein [Spirillospora albida]